MSVPSFIIVRYVWQILEEGAFLHPFPPSVGSTDKAHLE